MAYGLTQSADLERSSSQYFYAADSTSLSPTGNLTLEATINLESLPASGEEYDIMSKHDNGDANKRSFATTYENSGGTLRFIWRVSSDGTSANQTSATWNYTLSTGVFYRVAFAYSTAGTVECVVNGVSLGSVGSQKTSIYNSDQRFTIGARNSNGTPAAFFDGKISLVRMWDTTRSVSDIASSACVVYGTATANLLAEWSLNNVLTDASGNSNTLTNVNTAIFVASVPSTCTAQIKTRNGIAWEDIKSINGQT